MHPTNRIYTLPPFTSNVHFQINIFLLSRKLDISVPISSAGQLPGLGATGFETLF